jgi:hypothetical protein
MLVFFLLPQCFQGCKPVDIKSLIYLGEGSGELEYEGLHKEIEFKLRVPT